MYKLLEERGDILVSEKKWMLHEALDAKKLQSGGTFRNVIAKKLDEAIIPILSGIIARIDRSYNLDLIHQQDTPVAHFWLTMFGNTEIMGFHYEEVVSKEQVAGIGGRMTEKDFKCQLPFSWIIKETFDNHLDHAKSTAGDLIILITGCLHTILVIIPC